MIREHAGLSARGMARLAVAGFAFALAFTVAAVAAYNAWSHR